MIVVSFFVAICGAVTGPHHYNCTTGDNSTIQDGWCDGENNNAACLYDGGDCCPCTATNPSLDNVYYEYSFFCRDPNSGCVDPRVGMYPNCTGGDIQYMGDGWCDTANNNYECGYDGGDCCACTLETSLDDVISGNSLFCRDPNSGCVDPLVDIYPNCTDGDLSDIMDGWCDTDNNNEACDYDGGDCCPCTCKSGDYFACGVNGFSCVDPNALGMEPYICVEPPTIPTICPARLQQEWVVENSYDARELREAIRCLGGSFNVAWKGKIVLDETIAIFNGTVLNVTGCDADSAIIGDGQTRLFAVINASLHLQNIAMRNGTADYGGAIAASGSSLIFKGIIFSNNRAFSSGGAMYLSNSVTVSFGEDITFLNNTSFQGGAIFMTGGSNATWLGNTFCSMMNVATSGSGGGLYVANGSTVTWKGASYFLANRASLGGALFVTEGSTAIWAASSHFISNTAENGGGAICVIDGSSVVWTAASQFLDNISEDYGGALYVIRSSSAVWNAASRFSGNSARRGHGGAIYLTLGSSAVWTAASVFTINSAKADGGAVYAVSNVGISWSSTVLFSNNTARNGGAFFVKDGVAAEWTGEIIFTHNRARLDGGAIGSAAFSFLRSDRANNEGSEVAIKGATSFVKNTCGGNGGGMALVQSLAVSFETENILFSGNLAGASGGAVFIVGTPIGIVFRNVVFTVNVAQIGGGVHVTGSGSAITIGRKHDQEMNPTTFHTCKFIGNFAFGTGGAVDTASGEDVFNDTLFEANEARVGGALRLAGIASIVNCSFIENISGLDGGPAVSNIGYVSNVTTSYFHDNVFNCENQMFLSFNKVRSASCVASCLRGT